MERDRGRVTEKKRRDRGYEILLLDHRPFHTSADDNIHFLTHDPRFHYISIYHVHEKALSVQKYYMFY